MNCHVRLPLAISCTTLARRPRSESEWRRKVGAAEEERRKVEGGGGEEERTGGGTGGTPCWRRPSCTRWAQPKRHCRPVLALLRVPLEGVGRGHAVRTDPRVELQPVLWPRVPFHGEAGLQEEDRGVYLSRHVFPFFLSKTKEIHQFSPLFPFFLLKPRKNPWIHRCFPVLWPRLLRRRDSLAEEGPSGPSGCMADGRAATAARAWQPPAGRWLAKYQLL